MGRLAGLAIVLGMALVSASLGDEPPGPATGEVRLASGRAASYAIHFDRNSIRASVRSGDHLIAATSSGALLRFDLPGPRYVRERVDPEPITCLGTGEGGAVIAGYGDGRIVAVDPTTLDVREMFKVVDEPQWIGRAPAVKGRKAGLIVATHPSEWRSRKTTLHDVAEGKTITVEDRATAFLIDRQGRLWLGSDHGEWGGNVWRVDLVEGTVTGIMPPPSREPDRQSFWRGIYGFMERPDGQLWAHGGTMHMGSSDASIARIDGADPRLLYLCESTDDDGKFADPSMPSMPISHLVEADGSLRAFAYNGVFRGDDRLKNWRQDGTLELRYRWGRPDAVGAYPSVSSVHVPGRAGEPWILATLADGYVTLDGAKAVSRSVPGQLDTLDVREIRETRQGLVFFEGEGTHLPWILGPKGWEVARLVPPFEVDPNGDAATIAAEKEEGKWDQTQMIVDPRGNIITVSTTNRMNGTLTTTRWAGGKPMRIGRERSDLNLDFCFVTGDGTLWNALSGEFRRFEDGRWKLVAEGIDGASLTRLKGIGTQGPPWFLLERELRRPWRFEHGPHGENPRLIPLYLHEAGQRLRIEAAIPWIGGPGSVLLATDAGLRTYEPVGGTVAKVALPAPPGPILAVSRDGLGRLWIGRRDGLWLLEQASKSAEAVGRIPGMGRGEVTSLALDPQHKDGIVAGLGDRGVAFVRVPAP
ncbi:hypothetical protein [Aquisphaera insulae]|uniref:hypothetical protein n=1 Tax=Aquisphaera insulae TaxID=2712864 RepID=UPI0013E9DA44|nr:hypothetical protein [Aquisphaera insulae]